MRSRPCGRLSAGAWPLMAKGLGLVLLYCCAWTLAPPSTSAGLRRIVLPRRRSRPRPPALNGAAGTRWPCTVGIRRSPTAGDRPPELEGASKRARLAWWYERDAAYGDRPAAAATAKRLAPVVELSEGTARAYIAQILADLEKAGEAS